MYYKGRFYKNYKAPSREIRVVTNKLRTTFTSSMVHTCLSRMWPSYLLFNLLSPVSRTRWKRKYRFVCQTNRLKERKIRTVRDGLSRCDGRELSKEDLPLRLRGKMSLGKTNNFQENISYNMYPLIYMKFSKMYFFLIKVYTNHKARVTLIA